MQTGSNAARIRETRANSPRALTRTPDGLERGPNTSGTHRDAHARDAARARRASRRRDGARRRPRAATPIASASSDARRATRRVALATTAIDGARTSRATRATRARGRSRSWRGARRGGDATADAFTLEIELPRGYHFTEGANSRCETPAAASGTRGALEGDGGAARTVVVRRGGGAWTRSRVDCVVYFCRTDDVCLMQRVRFEVPVATGGASATTAAKYVVAPEANDAAVPSFD